ncbi:MAG: YihY/virulence factor BrkB family protein [Chitinophagaceae bacterium]|nr:YihY/virulence factor BrkB family protein [Chitinophagaceae bacterium]
MNKKKTTWNLPVFWNLLKNSFRRLKRNDPLRMAGATAFFTCFALPPIIVLLFQLFSIFFSRQLVGSELGEVLDATLGNEGSTQLRNTARSLRNLANNWYMALMGLVFLVFVATTLFQVIRNTFNDIWNIRLERSGFVYGLKVRARSLVVILAAAVLFLAAAVIDLINVFSGKYITKISEKGSVFFTGALHHITGMVIVTVWFIVLFRFLANARPSWRVATAGGIVTGVLFSLGKSLLSTILANSNPGAVYGAGGAIILILLFVFYASFILYFGASFIKEYALVVNDPIVPSHRAYQYELQKVSRD